MKVSFIVSAFSRPDHLACCLYSLKAQTCGDFEVLVADNGDNAAVVEAMQDPRFRRIAAGGAECYDAANRVTPEAQGDYLCFPSDDGYYAPRFLELMLKAKADLIYCDCVYDGHGCTANLMHVRPEVGWIDKGGFLLRRERFIPFEGPVGQDRPADGWLVQSVLRAGATSAKVPGYLWMHN